MAERNRRPVRPFSSLAEGWPVTGSPLARADGDGSSPRAIRRRPPFFCPEVRMNIFYIIGVIVVIIAILSFLGLT